MIGTTVKIRTAAVVVRAAIAVIIRSCANAAPAAAIRPATPIPAAGDLLDKAIVFNSRLNAGRYRDRHGIGAIRNERPHCKNGKRNRSCKNNPAHCFLHPNENLSLSSCGQDHKVEASGGQIVLEKFGRIDGHSVHRLFIAEQPISYRAWERD